LSIAIDSIPMKKRLLLIAPISLVGPFSDPGGHKNQQLASARRSGGVLFEHRAEAYSRENTGLGISLPRMEWPIAAQP
jgi:hypothetical protein